MPISRVGDNDIYYEIHGRGAPLVLISGLGNSTLNWWKQIESLGERYQVITLDNRGIGNSSRVSRAFTIVDLAEDVARLIHNLNLAPSHVLGVSMGGFIALTLCRRHPELVRKLILVSTSAGGSTHVAPGKAILDIVLNRETADIEAYYRKLYPALAGPGYMQSHPEDLNRIVANAHAKPLPPETYLFQLNAIGEYTLESHAGIALDRIEAQSLVLHGDADPLVPFANGQYLAKHIKDARFVQLPGRGHLLPIEAADRLNREVTLFLE